MRYKIIKISDDKFKGNHPHLINEGYSFEGESSKVITVGEPLILLTTTRFFKTSTVQSIDEINKTFKTKNSTYSWQILDEL